jgi:hypothetical protein
MEEAHAAHVLSGDSTDAPALMSLEGGQEKLLGRKPQVGQQQQVPVSYYR